MKRPLSLLVFTSSSISHLKVYRKHDQAALESKSDFLEQPGLRMVGRHGNSLAKVSGDIKG